MSFLNDWLTASPRIQASTVVVHGMSDRTARRASCMYVRKLSARWGVASAFDDEKTGGPPAVGKMHRLAGASNVSSRPGWAGS
jgi:hypothetical protein